jgi:hypothetical protein
MRMFLRTRAVKGASAPASPSPKSSPKRNPASAPAKSSPKCKQTKPKQSKSKIKSVGAKRVNTPKVIIAGALADYPVNLTQEQKDTLAKWRSAYPAYYRAFRNFGLSRIGSRANFSFADFKQYMMDHVKNFPVTQAATSALWDAYTAVKDLKELVESGKKPSTVVNAGRKSPVPDKREFTKAAYLQPDAGKNYIYAYDLGALDIDAPNHILANIRKRICLRLTDDDEWRCSFYYARIKAVRKADNAKLEAAWNTAVKLLEGYPVNIIVNGKIDERIKKGQT